MYRCDSRYISPVGHVVPLMAAIPPITHQEERDGEG